jgi:hypothetical protein
MITVIFGPLEISNIFENIAKNLIFAALKEGGVDFSQGLKYN